MVAPFDINRVFAQAEAAYRVRQFDAARRDLLSVLRATGEHAAVLHLLALVEEGAGRTAAARAAFVRALKQAPADPQINNNYANLLDSAGETDAALTYYDRAIATVPQFTDARLNRAATLNKLGSHGAALDDLDALLPANENNPRLWELRGAAHRTAGDLAVAADDFDRALALSPDRQVSRHGAARVALERSDDTAAVAHYRLAYAAAPADAEVALGFAEALEAAGEPGAIPILAAAVARQPRWTAGHDALARMRSEAGDPEDFARSYVAALRANPGDRALHVAHWHCLARGSRHAEALAAFDAAHLTPDPQLTLIEAVLASETGLIDRADTAFAKAGDGAEAQLGRGRHSLRRGDPQQAAALLEPLARADLDLVTAWAHLGMAWRLTSDPRCAWLYGQAGLYAARDLDLEISELAPVLRGLHRTRAHPIGQSLRGGTQTRGRLFDRPDPDVQNLHRALTSAIAAHFALLPPQDSSHPLLRHRDAAPRIDGSWSVRLADGGFHVNHIHPRGVLSSACYIALPAGASGDPQAGWLELGTPPEELGLDLGPLATIEPQPGRLALFPSYLFHGTRPFAVGERLTVAFDVVS